MPEKLKKFIEEYL